MESSGTDSDVSLCTRLLAEFEDVTSEETRALLSLEDEGIKDAVDGLLLLRCTDQMYDSASDSDEEEEEEEEDEEEEDEDEDEEAEEEEDQEVRPCLEGKTWNWKKTLSVYKSCDSPPPSPENEHIAKLREEMDSLLHRRAVFTQELERVQAYQNELKAFNLKLRKKLEESDDQSY